MTTILIDIKTWLSEKKRMEELIGILLLGLIFLLWQARHAISYFFSLVSHWLSTFIESHFHFLVIILLMGIAWNVEQINGRMSRHEDND